jgi:hypothetical protein
VQSVLGLLLVLLIHDLVLMLRVGSGTCDFELGVLEVFEVLAQSEMPGSVIQVIGRGLTLVWFMTESLILKMFLCGIGVVCERWR